MPEREPTAVEFGNRVRALRQQKGLSQERLGELVGISKNYVSSVELGERNVGLRTILLLGHALGVAPASLIEGLPKPE
ncbi:MAG TPA: helix-turn-helix transcriptional regulator [Acidimicrobiales bacterium]|nr:helix-turn-helix transcriptional regulator [Acidimicrobiales bacterium]